MYADITIDLVVGILFSTYGPEVNTISLLLNFYCGINCFIVGATNFQKRQDIKRGKSMAAWGIVPLTFRLAARRPSH